MIKYPLKSIQGLSLTSTELGSTQCEKDLTFPFTQQLIVAFAQKDFCKIEPHDPMLCTFRSYMFSRVGQSLHPHSRPLQGVLGNSDANIRGPVVSLLVYSHFLYGSVV